MRGKVNIDDDLMAELRSRAQVGKTSMTYTLNRVVRASLAASSGPCEGRERYEEVPVRMGRPRVKIGKALALAAHLEDEEVIRKMASRQ